MAVGGAHGVPGPLVTRLLAAAQLTRCTAKILYRKLETYMELRSHGSNPYNHVSLCDLYRKRDRGRAVPFLVIYKSKFLCSVEPFT